MKKTKLLTSIAALALVLSLGACTEPEEEETSSEESGEVTTESDTTPEGDTTGEPTDYVLVGDFVDSDWDNEPATDSKYFIPAGTEEFKVTITTASEPVDNEWWSETNQWDAGLSVVEYGTWNRVAGYTELDQDASTGVKGSSNSNDVSLAWNTTYDVTLTFGETNSIIVKEVEDNTITEMLATVAEGNNYYAENTYILYQSDVVSNTQEGVAGATASPVQWFECDVYATQDALYLDYYQIVYPYMYYMDAELYVNDYENNQTLVYYVDSTQGTYGMNESYQWILHLADTLEGTWQDSIWSLMDLADYSWAFSVAETGYNYAYGTVEDYDVDESALDTLLNATIGNNYIWDSVFGTMGWNYYFGFADAADIYSYTEYCSDYYYGYYGQVLEIGFTDGGAWYYSGYNEDYTDYAKDDDGNYLILYQEAVAYTDIYLDKIGQTEIPEDSYTIVEEAD